MAKTAKNGKKKTSDLKKTPVKKTGVETIRKTGASVKKKVKPEEVKKEVSKKALPSEKKKVVPSYVPQKGQKKEVPKKKKVPKKVEKTVETSVSKKEVPIEKKIIQKKISKTSKLSLWKEQLAKRRNEKKSTLKDKPKKEKKERKLFIKKDKSEKPKKALIKKEKIVKKSSSVDELKLIKLKKVFKIVLFLCITVLLVEGIYIVVKRYQGEQKNVYYDALNSIDLDREDTIAVGSSFFKYSSENKYTDGLEKGKFVKYDKRGKLLFEVKYNKGINSTFTSVLTLNDGYLVTGSVENSQYQNENQIREALLIKYDKDGKVIWEDTHKVLSNTRFTKAILVDDGYIVVGQSIYENMEMGNHTTGGGIIVKYDFEGNVVWEANHGGNKSGIFHDVVSANNAYYAVGRDSKDTGVLVKFSKDGKYQWHKNYSYTDSEGFMGIAYSHNALYVVGSKKILKEVKEDDTERATTNTDALIIKYDFDGNISFEKTFGGSNYERYNSIISSADSLYVVGHTTSTDSGLKVTTDDNEMTGMVMKYDLNGHISRKDTFGGSGNDNLVAITTDNSNLYIAGYSNSKDGNLVSDHDNGKDYFGKYLKIDSRFRILFVG